MCEHILEEHPNMKFHENPFDSRVITCEHTDRQTRRRSFLRSKRRWKDNTYVDLRESVYEGMDLVQLASVTVPWGDLANMIMILQNLLKEGNSLTSRSTISFSRGRPILVHGAKKTHFLSTLSHFHWLPLAVFSSCFLLWPCLSNGC
jgi:hypothetical protein